MDEKNGLREFYSSLKVSAEKEVQELHLLIQCVGESKAKLRVIDLLERILEKIDATHPPLHLRSLKKDITDYVIHLCKKVENFQNVATFPKNHESEHMKVANEESMDCSDLDTEEEVLSQHQEDTELHDNEDDSTIYLDDLDSNQWEKDFIRNKSTSDQSKVKISKTSLHYNFITCILLAIFVWKITFMISDNAVMLLLSLLAKLFQLLQFQSTFIGAIAAVFPGSMYLAKQWMGIDSNEFERYIVCSKCFKLYPNINDLIITTNEIRKAKLCNNKINLRGTKYKICENDLLVKTILKDGKVSFTPINTYCYRPIIESIEQLLQRPEIENQSNQWRKREYQANILADIYDGQVWKDFMKYKGQDFLSMENNYGLMLNIDWFQPYKRRNNKSVGVIYATLMNLPRNIRFRRENVIIIAIIPSFHHEPDSLDTFLSPLVAELKVLWRGLKMHTKNYSQGVNIRCALMCIAADIPACRKICGFYSHAATMGCNKCYVSFGGGFGEKRDYSGFNTNSWQLRTHQQHLEHIKQIKAAKSKTARHKIEQKYGVRYSTLLELDYYDAIKHNVVDPMHNLFLGISKTMWKIWTSTDTISALNILTINTRLEQLRTSHGSSHIPQCISSNWGTWTAHEWKVWTLSCSLYCLNDILNQDQLKCWQKFVKACDMLCKPYISKSDVHISQLLLIDFSKQTEIIFGKSVITPNMHLSCHLENVILDYGPVYSIWLFSFERYNGIMSSISTNHHGIEIQLMRKFLQQSYLCNITPQIPSSEYKSQLSSFLAVSSDPTIVCDTKLLSFQENLCQNIHDWSVINCIKLPGMYKIKCFDTDEKEMLLSTYNLMYSNDPIFNDTDICSSYQQYSQVTIANETFFSKLISRNYKSTLCIAKNLYDVKQPCEIRSFVQHKVQIGEKDVQHLFAAVSWMSNDENIFGYLEPTTVWKPKSDRNDQIMFLPVQRIVSRCTYAIVDNSIVLTPFQKKIYA